MPNVLDSKLLFSTLNLFPFYYFVVFFLARGLWHPSASVPAVCTAPSAQGKLGFRVDECYRFI